MQITYTGLLTQVLKSEIPGALIIDAIGQSQEFRCVLVLLNCVPILVPLDCFSLSITEGDCGAGSSPFY